MAETHALGGVRVSLLLSFLALAAFAYAGRGESKEKALDIPVRGLHTFAPAKKDLAAAIEFIREAHPTEAYLLPSAPSSVCAGPAAGFRLGTLFGTVTCDYRG